MKQYTYDAIVVGTGAAGYNAACRIRQLGKKSVAIVTEGTNCGTSRNTGSDKQTYYKLGLGGDAQDSVRKMAENLFAGGCVDGDQALCEAALSARCFMNLCELGVPFPVNRYGEYVGYKTDHDPYARATSAGPLTSKFMTEALQKQAAALEIQVYNGLLAVQILKYEDKVCGLLCLETETGELTAFRCGSIVLATGGPAGIYADSVYPKGHTGSTGLALLAGAKAQNLTEWQYGLASVEPRWNVSGTYMQVLPRFVSIDEKGQEREFLADYFSDPYEALSTVFLKGYQWPFDSKKVLEGSSVIDLLVYRERVLKKRKVFLDYRKNPFGLEQIAYEKLSPECRTYLEKADACFGAPIDRLLKMNAPAVELYRSKDLDLAAEYLEIALCAQHNNGGISVDLWWQTSVKGLFAAGECAGTHGITRPGGSALNAGQVGSLRAAQHISEHGEAPVAEEIFEKVLAAVESENAGISAAAGGANFAALEAADSANSAALAKADSANLMAPATADGAISLTPPFQTQISQSQRRMSDTASAIRSGSGMEAALNHCTEQFRALSKMPLPQSPAQRYWFFKLKDILVTQMAVLTAMLDYQNEVGETRGSSLNYDERGSLRPGLEEMFRFREDTGKSRAKIQEIQLTEEGFRAKWRETRPLPAEEDFFENVWRSYRENKNIF